MRFVGLASYLPVTVRRNEWWTAERRANFRTHDGDLVTSSGMFDTETCFRGISERRVVGDDESSVDMAVAAGRAALADANVDPSDVDALLHYSLVPDGLFPADHVAVAGRMSLKKSAFVTSVDSGPASFVAQLELGAAMIEAGRAKYVLLTQSNATSRLIPPELPSSVAIGDGATAVLLGASEAQEGYVGSVALTETRYLDAAALGTKDRDVPWYRGDLHKERLSVRSYDTDSAKNLGADATRYCVEACKNALRQHGFRSSDVDLLISTQCTSEFGLQCCEGVGVSLDRTVITYEEVGHLFASGAVHNLIAARDRGRTPPGTLVLLVVQGPGLQVFATLYRF